LGGRVMEREHQSAFLGLSRALSVNPAARISVRRRTILPAHARPGPLAPHPGLSPGGEEGGRRLGEGMALGFDARNICSWNSLPEEEGRGEGKATSDFLGGDSSISP
jgi:hypothetical protein